MKLDSIRKEFPLLLNKYDGKKIIYFDNACTALKHKSVIEAINDYYRNYSSCSGNRSSHFLSSKVNEICKEAREAVRVFINAASVKEIIWVKNSTEAINLVARSFKFEKNKNEVIITNHEHHSNILPFYELEKKGIIKIKILNINNNNELDLEELKKLTSSKTAIIAITHASNVTGKIFDVKEVSKIAHEKGAYVLVDDAQYIATHKEDVQENDIDFLCFSAHKIGGPTGIGVLYVNNGVFNRLENFNVGGGTIKSVSIRKNKINVAYLDGSARFEAGVQNYAGIFGLKATIEFINKVGYEDIFNTVSKVSDYLKTNLIKIQEVELLNKKIDKSSLVSFYFKKGSINDFNIYINNEIKNHIITLRIGNHCAMPLHESKGIKESVRASFYLYNNISEVDIFVKAIKKYISYL